MKQIGLPEDEISFFIIDPFTSSVPGDCSNTCKQDKEGNKGYQKNVR